MRRDRHIIRVVDIVDEEPPHQIPIYIQNRREWTEKEEAYLIEQFDKGAPLWEIAKGLNRTYYSVKEKCRALCLHREGTR